MSINGTRWKPGEAMEANSNRCYEGAFAATRFLPPTRVMHPAPEDNCACGIYAAKDINHLEVIDYVHFGIIGEINLWGKIVAHKLGYRAQYAYPKNLIVPTRLVPFEVAELEFVLQTSVFVYGVPVLVCDENIHERLLLWCPEKGINAEGADFLISNRAYWYNKPIPESVQIGDRVALLGKGIGIVLKIEKGSPSIDGTAHIEFKQRTIEVFLKNIVWSRQNNRFECQVLGYSTSMSPVNFRIVPMPGGHNLNHVISYRIHHPASGSSILCTQDRSCPVCKMRKTQTATKKGGR
jgi:hypothetical protein